MIIYRPYIDLRQSIECLSDFHLYKIGKINCFLLIRMILEQMEWTPLTYGGDLNNPTFKFYFNKGKPFLKDLVEYNKIVTVIWPKRSGTNHNTLIDNHNPQNRTMDLRIPLRENKDKWKNNKFDWTEEHARWHKLVLLNINHWWYKRHFRNHYQVDIDKFKKKSLMPLYNKFNKPLKISKEKAT